jgi:hypothetical protein
MITIDDWLIEPSQEEAFNRFKLWQLNRLRDLIKAEVGTHQEAALKSSYGAAAAEEYAEAARILLLYPMSEDPAITNEAKQLASRQAEIAGQLEAIRRQRYNKWATTRIEQALDYYNANATTWGQNTKLISSLATYLAQVDPAFLEPVVLELYNYVIDRTKSSLSEPNKLELARCLVNPSIERKNLGDF